jgi:hypothetical protein
MDDEDGAGAGVLQVSELSEGIVSAAEIVVECAVERVHDDELWPGSSNFFDEDLLGSFEIQGRKVLGKLDVRALWHPPGKLGFLVSDP